MSAQPDNGRDTYPELLSDLAAVVGESLQRRGVTPEHAAQVGFEAAEHVRKNWSGHSVYLPKGVEFELSRRDAEIFAAFDGTNIAQLADKYRLTEVRIYQIVKRVMTAERKRRQPDLFGRQ